MRSLVFEGKTGGACERLRGQDNLPARAEWQLRDIAAGEKFMHDYCDESS